MSKPAILRVVILGLVVFVSASGGAQAPQAPAPAKPLFERGGSVEAVPVDIFDRIVYLPVKVNGAATLVFVLDTGAGSISAIDKSVADSLGMRLTPVYRGPGGAGEDTIEVDQADSVTVSIPGIMFERRTVFTLPLHRMDPHWGKRKDGLVGRDLLSTLVTRIDYEKERIDFHDAASYEYSGPGESIPVTVAGGFIFVDVKVLLYGKEEPVDAFMMLDTGVRLSIFNTPFSRKHGLPDQSPKTVEGVTGFGVGGVSKGIVGRVRGVRIGSFLIEEPVVDFSIDEKGALADTSFSGIIGADFLSRFHVVLDYSRSRITLEKNRFFGDPYEFDMCGIRFIMEGERFDVLKVFSIFSSSPAAEAGIREGDIVTEIDGRGAGQFTREALREYMEREGKEVRFTIKRGEETQNIGIRLRRIV